MSPRPEIADDGPSHTIEQFCALENISKATFYKLDIKPRVMTLPGTSALRITAASRRKWHDAIAKANDKASAELQRQHEQRVERAAAAGKFGGAPTGSRKRARAA
jgi:hypothetical protein